MTNSQQGRAWSRIASRPRIAAGFMLGAVLAGVGLGALGAHWAASSVVGHYSSPGSILISADQRTLAATVGSCADGSLDAQETSATVTVRLHLWPAVMIAPGVCALQTFTATLDAPLGTRQLVDGITGARIPAFNGAGILRPAKLPAGFVHRYDTASLGTETVPHASAGCTQLYTQNDSYDEAIWISQNVDGQWKTPAGVRAQAIVVRGHPGLAIPGEIEWTAGGELFTIQSVTYAYATLSTSELIAIANSLR